MTEKWNSQKQRACVLLQTNLPAGEACQIPVADHPMQTPDAPPGFEIVNGSLSDPMKYENGVTPMLLLKIGTVQYAIPVTPVTECKENVNVVFVNPKQYKRILARRIERRKLISTGKVIPGFRHKYLHKSRHYHAATRDRGPGGRFSSKSPQTSNCSDDKTV